VAVVNTVWYTNFGDGSTTGYYAVTAWATGTVTAAGARRRQNAAPAVGSERVFICIIAGTTHASTEPTWILTQGAKTTDNTVTWMECTGKPAVNGDVTNTPLSSSARSQAVVLGNIVKNNTATHYFICTTAGTCGAGEPTYNTTTGGTTADNTATWTCIGAVGAFSAWNAPGARMATSWATTGDTVYVSSIHAETQAAALSIAPAGLTQYLCVANAGSTPPVAADLTTGASCTTTGNNTITLSGISYFQGIAFSCATGAFGTLFNISTGINSYVSMRNCALSQKGTANPSFVFGNSTGSKIELVNTTLGFGGGTGELVTWSGCQFVWRDTASALSAVGGTWPTNPFRANLGTLLIENVDLSAFAGSAYWNVNAGPSKAVFSRCKLAAITMIGATTSPGHAEIDVIACDTAGATYRHERWQPFEGNQTIETVVVHTGGASDGTTTFSWKIATQNTARWTMPFESLPITIWNPTTGADVTVTLEGLVSAAALPNNDDIWIIARYFGTAASTLGSSVTETKATPLTANAALTASTVAWDGAASARQNSHAYSLGDVIKVATNSGRIFFCTTAGTSAGSEPGGYASAVDGGSVTDSGAVFRAAVRFKLAVTLTGPQPQIAGYVSLTVRVGKLSATYYVDPKAVLS
jgi:hypothetical protein